MGKERKRDVFTTNEIKIKKCVKKCSPLKPRACRRFFALKGAQAGGKMNFQEFLFLYELVNEVKDL